MRTRCMALVRLDGIRSAATWQAWILGLFGLLLGSMLASQAWAQAPDGTGLEVYVTDRSTGLPVAGAGVDIPDLGLLEYTDASGSILWQGISTESAVEIIDILVSAPGYGEWRLEQARLLRAETLIVRAQLTSDPKTIVMPPPILERPSLSGALRSLGAAELEALAADADAPLPATIRVGITESPYCDPDAPYTVEVVDFKEYVRHVLPNEWISSWPSQSLRAGAMAVKMYAWTSILAGGRSDHPDIDVFDSTCDQVYNPAVEYASTNEAIEFTWNWRLVRGTELVRTYYRAYDSQCTPTDCMGQWGSYDKAMDGWTWEDILLFYYENTLLTPVWNPPGGFSLRFNGVYNDEENRVLIPIDDPLTTDPGPPVDVGGEDFTIEFWLKAMPGENAAGAISCGANQNWLYGNMILDRDPPTASTVSRWRMAG